MSYSKYLFESLSQIVSESDSFNNSEFVISESLNSALEKVETSLQSQTKDSKYYGADELKSSADQVTRDIKFAVRNYAREFAKVGIDLNKLEYSKTKSPDHVYKLLEQNNVVLLVRSYQMMMFSGDWTIGAIYTCIPLVENEKLANIAMYEIAYGNNYNRNGTTPANSFTKLTGKKQDSIKVVSVGSFKSAYADLLKNSSSSKDDSDHYDILFAPVDEELSKENLTKLKLRKANERASKQMTKNDSRLYVKNAKAFQHIMSNYSKAGLAAIDKFVKEVEKVQPPHIPEEKVMRYVDDIMRFKKDDIKTIQDAQKFVKARTRLQSLDWDITTLHGHANEITKAFLRANTGTSDVKDRGYRQHNDTAYLRFWDSTIRSMLLFIFYALFLYKKEVGSNPGSYERIAKLNDSMESVLSNLSPKDFGDSIYAVLKDAYQRELENYTSKYKKQVRDQE